MSDRQDAFHAKVETDRRRRAGFFFNNPGPWEVFFSEAGRAMASHPSATPVWLVIVSKQPLPPKKRERMRLEKLGLWPRPPEEFSFPHEEGPDHGIGKKATASGLLFLHSVGVINRLHPGSATRGDFARYVLSDRWRQWRPPAGGPDFIVLEWMKATVIGERDATIVDEDGIVVHKGTGKFLKRRTPKTSRKVHVVAPEATSKPSLAALKATREKTLAAREAVNKALDAELLVAPKAVFISSPVLDSDPRTGKKVQGKVRTLNRGSKDAAAPIRRDDAGRIKLNDLRKQVDELLVRNLPVNDVKNTPYAVSVLWDIYKGRIDVEKARFSLKSYFNDSIIMELFTLIGHTTRPKIRPAAIPTWPDQGQVQDLCDGLLLDALDRFGDDGQLHPEMATARNLTKIINRAVGSRVTN